MIHGGLDRSQAEVKLDRYRRSLAMLENVIPDRRLVEVLRFEIEALEQLPPIDGAHAVDAG